MIAAAGTIVVKVGSSSLTQPSGHLDPDKLDALAAALAQVRLMGGRVVLVSSGAIAAGFGPLGFDSRPEIVKPSSCRISARPLMLIPPMPMKWMCIGLLKSILYINFTCLIYYNLYCNY